MINEQIELPEPYRTALAEALAFVRERWQPLGIIAAGSVLRGEGGPTSDIDLYVIHSEAWRQRSQRRHWSAHGAHVWCSGVSQVWHSGSSVAWSMSNRCASITLAFDSTC